ncbi:MAG: xanthine dehydrogenase family protein molybdopterin-binding subunit [Candidatus Rokuibacteriota bacterium]
MWTPATGAAVGQSPLRPDGLRKVTGTATYVPNLERPGMVHAVLVRSTRPHARIRGVDATRARELAGVVAVVTGADVTRMPDVDPWLGPAFRDQPVLAIDRVRYVGEPVAAVVAGDRETALAAAERIRVDYDDLPAVFDVLEAAKPGAPLVHEELKPANAFADLAHLAGRAATNVCYHYKLRRGDVDAAFRAADRVFEDTLTSPPVQHVPLETHACLAFVEDDVLTVWSTTQTPSFVRQELAGMLGLPLNRVRVRVPYLGGGYGAKMYDKLEPITALLARVTGRPVRAALSREEEFVTITRHGVVVRVRSAWSAGAELLAMQAEVFWDTGAYADIGPRIAGKSGMTALGPYRIPHARIDSYCVYTNKPPAGAYRGFGVPQMVWAHESHLDRVARELDQDPVALRRRLLLRDGDPYVTGAPVRSEGVRECLERVVAELGPALDERAAGGRYARGAGVACGMKAVLTPSISGAIVQMSSDASVAVLSSTVEMGQGSETILAQIVAEELTVPVEHVRLVQPDTEVTPYDTITAGSRSTYHMGNAVRLAAREVRRQLLAAAADRLEAHPDDLDLAGGGVVVRGVPDRTLSIPEVFIARFGSRGTTMVGEAVFQTRAAPADPETGQSERTTEHWFPAAAGAQVEVDRATGRVRVLKLVVAADVGRAINPRHCRQQIAGAALMGLGHALFEQMVFDQGQVVNGTLLDYQVPSILDLPDEIVPVVVEVPHPGGPFGAKGVGESGLLAVSPAVANAVAAAVGVRIRDLPLTAERVLGALRGAGPAR